MKSFIKYNHQTRALLSILLTALLVGCFYPLLTNDPITKYDDQLLLGGVDNLHSLHEYKERFLAGKVLDIQPVRDLSYFIDYKIKSVFPFHTFHLTNLLLWLGICFLFKGILDLIDDEKDEHQWLIWSFVFLYALSPVFTSSVAWIAGRKHLLSTFFTMFATFLFLKKKNLRISPRRLIGISFVYLLAVLSQPINVLWPVFVIAYSILYKKLNERKVFIGILALIAILVLAANLYYYGTLYEMITGGDGKYDSAFGPGLSLLALGRYFYLTIFPFDALPVSHYQGSWENMLGLVLLISFLFWVYKRRIGAGTIICFILYFFLPLIPVTYKITRIFCSDTYLLNASLGIYIALFLILKNVRFKYLAECFFLYVGILFIFNIGYVKIFMNTESIWNYAYAKEATPMSISNKADGLLVKGNYKEAKILIDQLEIMEPDNRFFVKLKSDLIYNDPQVSDADKIKRLDTLTPKAPIVYLRLALLHSNSNNVIGFNDNITKFFSDPIGYIKNSYLRNEEVIALIKVACEKNNLEINCKKQYDKFSRAVWFTDWNSELYKKNYFEIKKHPGQVFYR